MELSPASIETLRDFITGDNGESPYNSGPELVNLFNQYGFNDEYRQGFPSRWKFAQERIETLNDSEKLKRLIEDLLHPANFVDEEFDRDEVASKINDCLNYDGYELLEREGVYQVVENESETIKIESLDGISAELEERYIQEQIAKCKRKIGREDYDGAITNARTLLEAILLGLEAEFDDDPDDYNGKLSPLFSRVRDHLNLDPSREDIPDVLIEMLSGMISVVSGISGFRNKLSDAHPRKINPPKHHAKLAVNAVNTLSEFLFETYEYQKEKGSIEVD